MTSSETAHRRLRTEPAAEYLGLSRATLEKQRHYGIGPTFCKLGRIVVYDTRDLDAYLAESRRTNTSQAAA